MVTDRLFK